MSVIYVAGPYSADTAAGKRENTMEAIDAGLELLEKGHYPFIPHLTHFVDKRADEIGVTLEYEDYMEWDQRMLEQCSALFYLGSSPGADKELAEAKDAGMWIYEEMEEVPNVTKLA